MRILDIITIIWRRRWALGGSKKGARDAFSGLHRQKKAGSFSPPQGWLVFWKQLTPKDSPMPSKAYKLFVRNLRRKGGRIPQLLCVSINEQQLTTPSPTSGHPASPEKHQSTVYGSTSTFKNLSTAPPPINKPYKPKKAHFCTKSRINQRQEACRKKWQYPLKKWAEESKSSEKDCNRNQWPFCADSELTNCIPPFSSSRKATRNTEGFSTNSRKLSRKCRAFANSMNSCSGEQILTPRPTTLKEQLVLRPPSSLSRRKIKARLPSQGRMNLESSPNNQQKNPLSVSQQPECSCGSSRWWCDGEGDVDEEWVRVGAGWGQGGSGRAKGSAGRVLFIDNMNSQNYEEDSMNFSVIDRNEERRQYVDFSLDSLLHDQPSSTSPDPPTDQSPFPTFNNPLSLQSPLPSHPSPADACPHDFLRDLSRMQKELSFESQQHNIYDQQASISHELKSKTMSWMQLTKAATSQSVSKGPVDYNYYEGTLLIECKNKKDPRRKRVSYESIGKVQKDSQRKEKDQERAEKLKRKHTTSKELESIKLTQTHKFYRPYESVSKNIMVPTRSKSKSVAYKLPFNCFKSQSHMKASTDAETFSSKVFTEYYRTEAHHPTQKPKRKKQTINLLKSKEKSSKSKQKLTLNSLTLHSPRMKTSITTLPRKPKP